VALAAVLTTAGWIAMEATSLPPTDQIRGQLFAHRAPLGQGTWMPLWAMSQPLQTTVVAWEDPPFFGHQGLNYHEIARAAVINLRAGGYERGASTITQQVAKNLFVGPEKTLRRKVREAIVARRIEQALTKDEILTVYLNIAEWGDGIVGAEAAAWRYFGKPASDLDWSEAALLAGILPNPRDWNPCADPGRALRQRHAVLVELHAAGLIAADEFRSADAVEAAPCVAGSPPAIVSVRGPRDSA
jgi:membrane peptidoglycan carboxypeptidase